MEKSQKQLPADRSFGILFSIIFILLSTYLYIYKPNTSIWLVFGIISCLFIFITFFSPQLFRPLNIVWYYIGVLLGKIVSPIVLGVLFFLLITPVAVLGRIMGRDILKLKRNSAATYWIERHPPGPSPENYKNQF